MSVLALFFRSLVAPVYMLLRAYYYVILAAIIISWLDAFGILNTYNSTVSAIRDVVRRLTEPYFAFFRKFVPPVGMIDISSLLALLFLFFLQNFLPNLLLYLASAVS